MLRSAFPFLHSLCFSRGSSFSYCFSYPLWLHWRAWALSKVWLPFLSVGINYCFVLICPVCLKYYFGFATHKRSSLQTHVCSLSGCSFRLCPARQSPSSVRTPLSNLSSKPSSCFSNAPNPYLQNVCKHKKYRMETQSKNCIKCI